MRGVVVRRLLVGACLVVVRLHGVPFPDKADIVMGGIPSPYFLSFGDLNNDGSPDLLVSSWGPRKAGKHDPKASRVFVFLQKEGTFAPAPDREFAVPAPWGTLVGDFDDDGKSDLAVTQTSRYLHLFLGAENLGVDHANLNVNHSSHPSSRRVVAARLGKTGKMDFLCGPTRRQWHGGDTFRPGYCYGPEINDNGTALIADLNGDGHQDIVFHANLDKPRGIRLYYGPFPYTDIRRSELSEYAAIAPGTPLAHIAVGDLNGDGRPDLVASTRHKDPGQCSVLVYAQDAPQGFRGDAVPSGTIRGAGGALHIADFDRDGRQDLLVAHARTRRLHVFLQKQAAAAAASADAADQTIVVRNYAVATGDIDGDGFPDLAVSDGVNTVRIFLNTAQEAADRDMRSGPTAVAGAPEPQGHAKPVPAAAARPARAPAPATAEITIVAAKPALPAKPAARPKSAGEPAAAAARAPASSVPNPDHDPDRMPYYTGRIIPTPRKAVYGDEYPALSDASVIPGAGLAADGPYVNVLRRRIEKYGGKLTAVDSVAAASNTLILLGDIAAATALLDGNRVPEREQGYLLHTTRHDGRQVIILQGRDRQGLLWAIASFNQLVHVRDGNPVVRAATVVDFPACPNRGFIAGAWPDGADYCVAFKLNKPVFQSALVDHSVRNRSERAKTWRNPLTAKIRDDLRRIGETLSPFGIQWYAGINPIVGEADNKIRSKSDGDFRVALDWIEALAEAGGNLCLKYDDNRFPLSPDDLRDFGTARAADTYFLKRLCQALETRAPRMKILFCPPFYWGPTSSALYSEPRDDYLYALGELPRAVEIFWTGPRVKSGKVTPDMVAWIRNRIQRKPVYWQNGFGNPHMYGYHFMTDPIPVWRDWYYDGFHDGIDTYMPNCMMPGYAAAVVTLADYCWNPKAYDPAQSVEQAVTKLVGADTYPAIVKLNQALSYFDPYELRVTPGAAKQAAEFERRLDIVNTVWEEVETANLPAVERWGMMGHHVSQVNRFCARLKRTPSLAAYAKQASASQEHAKAEAGFSPNTGQFLSAFDFLGGYPAKVYGNRCEKRLATWIYGKRSANPRMRATFRVEPFPASTDYTLIVSAHDDDAEKKCRIRVLVNGTEIFAGENPFVRLGWSRHTFRIPATALTSRSSVLRIENTEDTGRVGGPPFFMLNYAVVRRGE